MFSETLEAAFERFDIDPSEENYETAISTASTELGTEQLRMCIMFYRAFGNANLLDFVDCDERFSAQKQP